MSFWTRISYDECFPQETEITKACHKMRRTLYHSVVVFCFIHVCRGGNVAKHDARSFGKIVKKASSSVGMSLDTLLVAVAL